MKKQLLCTSAIAFGVAAAPAAAQDWSVGVGGYYNFYTGFSSIDDNNNALGNTDYEGLQINVDSEIYISPSIDLDNGMTFGVDFQLEGADGGDMDEVYMYAESDTFGRLEAGSHNSAGYLMSVGAPSAGGLPINSGSVSAFVPFATSGGIPDGNGVISPGAGTVNIANTFVGAGYSSYIEVGGGTYGNSDIARLTYFSPDFNGFTFGVSYAPGDASGADGSSGLVDRNAGQINDIFDIGVNYSQSFKNTDVTISARYGTGEAQGLGIASVPNAVLPAGVTAPNAAALHGDPKAWAIGAQVGVGAFTFGGSYEVNDNDLDIVNSANGNVLADDVLDEEGYTLGMTYDVSGPWTVGIDYKYGEADHGSVLGEDVLSNLKVSGSRNLGPGVTWGVGLVYTEVDAADPSEGTLLGGPNGGVEGTDLEATTLTTSLKFAF